MAMRAGSDRDATIQPQRQARAHQREVGVGDALTREVEREGADAWKLDSTLSDLHRHVAQMKDTAMQAEFTALIARLEAI